MKPKLWWPSNKVQAPEDIQWLVDNQHKILAARKTPSRATRPILEYSGGRVRIEFVGTYTNAQEARHIWKDKIS